MRDPISEPYWQAASSGRLSVQRCATCRAVRHYPQRLCAVCASAKFDWIDAGRTGTLHSWTVVHHAFDPAFAAEVPYTVVILDLPEGCRVMARLDPQNTAALRIGLPMRIASVAAADGSPIWMVWILLSSGTPTD